MQKKEKVRIQALLETDKKAKSKMPKYTFIVSLIFSVTFIFLIWILGPLLQRFELGPDQGAAWYYWQLPEAVLMTQIIVWFFYLFWKKRFKKSDLMVSILDDGYSK